MIEYEGKIWELISRVLKIIDFWIYETCGFRKNIEFYDANISFSYDIIPSFYDMILPIIYITTVWDMENGGQEVMSYVKIKIELSNSGEEALNERNTLGRKEDLSTDSDKLETFQN